MLVHTCNQSTQGMEAGGLLSSKANLSYTVRACHKSLMKF